MTLVLSLIPNQDNINLTLSKTVVLSLIPTQDLRKAVVLNLTLAQGSINPNHKKDNIPEFGSQPRHAMRYFKSLYKF